jgi:hypothetical protein
MQLSEKVAQAKQWLRGVCMHEMIAHPQQQQQQQTENQSQSQSDELGTKYPAKGTTTVGTSAHLCAKLTAGKVRIIHIFATF